MFVSTELGATKQIIIYDNKLNGCSRAHIKTTPSVILSTAEQGSPLTAYQPAYTWLILALITGPKHERT